MNYGVFEGGGFVGSLKGYLKWNWGVHLGKLRQIWGYSKVELNGDNRPYFKVVVNSYNYWNLLNIKRHDNEKKWLQSIRNI